MFHRRPEPGLALVAPEPETIGRRPGERIRATLWVTGAFWGTNFAIFTLANWLEDHPKLAQMAAMRVALAGFGFLLCLGILFVLRKLVRQPLRTRAIVLVLAAPIAAEIYAWAAYFGYGWVNGRALHFAIEWSSAISVVATWSWFFIGWAGLCLAFEYHFDAQEERLRSAEFRALAETAKQRALHSQVNPHFLFNSLNSISALINERDIARADRMIDLLATYFRKMLAVDPAADIPLKEEIGLELEYLEIERSRYPDLAVEIDVDPELRAMPVPALILQPLVENAIKHGVARSVPPAKIVVRARRDGDMMSIAVENHGRARRAPSTLGSGVGVANVRERLLNRYGDRQSFTLEPLGEGDGFAATIRMPLTERR